MTHWKAALGGNGHDKYADERLMGLRHAFKEAWFLNNLGRKCAEMIVLGMHRKQHIPDAIIMEIYGSITEGKDIELIFTSDEGNGYRTNIESYADLIKLMRGDLAATPIVKAASR